MAHVAGSGDADDATATDAIVIDVGSMTTKVGFSGEDSPRTRFASVVGINTQTLDEEEDARSPSSVGGAPAPAAALGGGGGGGALGDDALDPDEDRFYFGGDAVLPRRATLNVSKPIHRGVVHDWDALERLWEWSFSEELSVDPEAFPVLVMDSVLEQKKSREMMAKIMFEKFNVKSFYVATQAVLSLFSSGVTSGMAVECGDEVSRAVPVFEGYALRHAAASTRLASRNVYAHFGKGLQAANPQHQKKLAADPLDLGCLVNRLKEEHVCAQLDGPPSPDSTGEVTHELPDGSVIHVPHTVCAGSGELLFDPAAYGIRDQKSVTDVVLESLDLCDNDLKAQFNKVISVAGGTAMVNGFAGRLEAELRESRLPNADLSQVKVSTDSNLMDSSWVGGSMLASLSTFSFMKIRKQEYDDAHAVIVHRKCF